MVDNYERGYGVAKELIMNFFVSVDSPEVLMRISLEVPREEDVMPKVQMIVWILCSSRTALSAFISL